jgi:hypothetical protein
MFYQELLESLAKAIESPASADATETEIVAMLLGLYQVILFLSTLKILLFFSKEAGELILMQIIMASETDHGAHEAHAKDMSVLIEIEHLPLNLSGTVRSSHISSLHQNVRVSENSPIKAK